MYWFGDVLCCLALAIMIFASVYMELRNRKEARAEVSIAELEAMLQERDEEAEFGRLMQIYGEMFGQECVEEYERVQNDPNFEIPDGLDEKCLAAIDAAFDN